MNILLVVDLQKEFAKDMEGRKRYKRAIEFIETRGREFGAIYATVYINNENPNMGRLVNWSQMQNIQPLDFTPDKVMLHSGYAPLDIPNFTPFDKVTVFGFDTDACVLDHCFRIFDMGANLEILEPLCWSSGGKKMHEAGLACMKRQFRNGVKT